MKKQSKTRKLICLFLLISCTLSYFDLTFAHERGEHDEDIEYVLFGNKDYKNTHPVVSKKIQDLEDATYLCVDQFNGSGEEALNNLKNDKIPGMPASISEFDFTSNYSHRGNTHRGWNMSYPPKAHWDIRQRILRNTVDEVLFSTVDTPLSWFPWLSDKVYGKNNNKQQSESFCVLLYNIHVLGDHIEAKKYQDLAYVAPLTRLNDPANPGVIPDLIKYSESLFASQTNTYRYKEYKQELEVLRDRSAKLMSATGEVSNEEDFKAYHQIAHDLMDLLRNTIPDLLRNEAFFSKTFY